MSDNNKNKTDNKRDFLRYRQDEMTGEERNDFERELQKDAFAEEADEGLGSLSSVEIRADLNMLKKNLSTRIRSKRRYINYRIAASVAVLMVISSVFIIINRTKPEQQISDLSLMSQPIDIFRSQPIKEPAIAAAKSGEKSTSSKNIAERPADILIKSEPEEPVSVAAGEEIALAVPTDKKADGRMIPAEKDVVSEQITVPAASLARSKISSGSQARGRIISSEDNMPVPGASIKVKGSISAVVTDETGNFKISIPDTGQRTLVAGFIGMKSKEFEARTDSEIQVRLDPDLSSLDELVVVGYGSKRSELKKEINGTGYNPPQPLNGKPAFDKYIQENIRRPDTTTAGQRVAVVLSFLVKIDGSLDSIKVVRSPAKAFSDEAIRLIKSGPEWKPAEEDGKNLEDEVIIRIVFD
jgi:hypothetical protein